MIAWFLAFIMFICAGWNVSCHHYGMAVTMVGCALCQLALFLKYDQ